MLITKKIIDRHTNTIIFIKTIIRIIMMKIHTNSIIFIQKKIILMISSMPFISRNMFKVPLPAKDHLP